MAVQTGYTTTEFSAEAAKNKSLVAVVNNTGIIGVGIPISKGGGGFTVILDGIHYDFTSDGSANNKVAIQDNCVLKMAIAGAKPVEDGAITNTVNSYTRSVDDDGTVSYKKDESSELSAAYSITIDQLNAKDEFALQVLKSLLDKIPDPNSKSKNEIAYYCETAYKWAGYMMTESSKSRAIINDNVNSGNTRAEDVGYLNDNTEKLLNNIVAAIERTGVRSIESGAEVYSQRMAIPQLMTFLEEYVKDGNNTLKLKNVISAINGIKTSIEAHTAAQIVALNRIATAIENLQPNSENNNQEGE